MGTMYKLSCAVVLHFKQDQPTFGEVIEIVTMDEKIYLVTQLLVTTVFNLHYHAYEVNKTSTYHICEIEKLRDYHPLCIYRTFDTRLIRTFFCSNVLSDIDLQIIY